MKRFWVIGALIVVFGMNDYASSMIIEDSIPYPPKPKETSIQEMVDAGKGLVKETTELGSAMLRGVMEDGGVIATVRKHKRFYGSIFIFGIIFILWLRGRTK